MVTGGGEFAGYIWTGQNANNQDGQIFRCPNNFSYTGVSPKSFRVGPKGPIIRYTVVLANTNSNHKNKTAAAAPFALTGLIVQLPVNATYVKARVSPRVKAPGSTSKMETTLATPTYYATTHTVIFPDAPLAAGHKRKYTVWARVLPMVASPLNFLAASLKCPQLVRRSSATVHSSVGGK